MIVRSHLPWPLRWAVFALGLGFSAALALWAFEFGKEIAGLDRGARAELLELREEVERLRGEREGAISIANTADSLLKAERAAQERLAQQVKDAEAEILALKNDLGFFERLLPAAAGADLSVRALQAEVLGPGQLRFQALLMQPGRNTGEFNGRYELSLSGDMDGRPWSQSQAGGAQPLRFRQYRRIEGIVTHPPQATVRMVTLKVTDGRGVVLANLTQKM